MRISSGQLFGSPAALGVGAIAALIAAGVLFLSTSEAMLRAQFTSAFGAYKVAADLDDAEDPGEVASVPFAAGEDFWLGGAPRNLAGSVAPASWGGPVSVGDVITLSGPSGQRVYEVTNIAELPVEGVTHIAHGTASRGILLVTARMKGASRNQVIRFFIERSDAATPSQGATSANNL